MFYSLPAVVFGVFAVAVCGFALAKGGTVERRFAAAYLIAWLATLVAQAQTTAETFRWAVLAIDSVVLAVCFALIWRGPAWIVWVTGFQALVVASQVMNLFVVTPSADAFYTILNMAGYANLLALAIGTFWAWQERRASGME